MEHKLSIIGYGGIGGWHHININERVNGLTVKGAWDVRPEALLKAEENGLYVYSSLDELLNDPEIDIITVAVPNNFHKDLSIKCLRAGKNVVCEKPVTMNAAELAEIMAAAKETGKVFTVHHNRRWDMDFCIIKEILKSKTIGEPYFIESRVQGSRGVLHGWRGHKINGGGMLLDWGVHLLDQIMQLIDSPVKSVTAHMFKLLMEEVDDNIKLLFRFENGVSAMIEVSVNCFVLQPRWHVSGTCGTAVVDDWSCGGKIVKLNEEKDLGWDDYIVYTEAGPTRTMAPRPPETTSVLPLPNIETDGDGVQRPGWADFYRNVMDAIDNQAELFVTPEQVMRVMKVIDALFESDRLGKSVECNI